MWTLLVAWAIISLLIADDGTTDIGDFQYVVFNLITAAVFVGAFLRIDPQGLPTIPDTLLGLTSVSAALYVSKKAAGHTQPTIIGTAVQIVGSPANDKISATVPAGLVPSGGAAHIAGKVQVLSAFGATTPTFEVQLSR